MLLHRGKWRHHYPCIQLCAHSSDGTEYVSLLTILPRALSSVLFLLLEKKKSFFPQISFRLFWIGFGLNFHCLRSAYVTTCTAVRRAWSFFCLGLLLVLFIILHNLGFGYLKFCCKLSLFFLVANKKENLNVNQKHLRQCLDCLTPCMVWFEGRKGMIELKSPTSGKFCVLLSQLLKCNF